MSGETHGFKHCHGETQPYLAPTLKCSLIIRLVLLDLRLVLISTSSKLFLEMLSSPVKQFRVYGHSALLRITFFRSDQP